LGLDLNKRLDLTCPNCGKRFHQTLAWFVEHSEVACPGCGSTFGIEVVNPEALPEDGPTIPQFHSFFTKIAGVSHPNTDGKSRQAIIARCHIGEELLLLREPDNPADKNAVKVVRLNSEQIGYIPAHVTASGLAKELDRGDKIRCRISDLTGGEGLTRGVNIEVGDWVEPAPALADAAEKSSATRIGWVLLLLATAGGIIFWAILRLQ